MFFCTKGMLLGGNRCKTVGIWSRTVLFSDFHNKVPHPFLSLRWIVRYVGLLRSETKEKWCIKQRKIIPQRKIIVYKEENHCIRSDKS